MNVVVNLKLIRCRGQNFQGKLYFIQTVSRLILEAFCHLWQGWGRATITIWSIRITNFSLIGRGRRIIYVSGVFVIVLEPGCQTPRRENVARLHSSRVLPVDSPVCDMPSAGWNGFPSGCQGNLWPTLQALATTPHTQCTLLDPAHAASSTFRLSLTQIYTFELIHTYTHLYTQINTQTNRFVHTKAHICIQERPHTIF